MKIGVIGFLGSIGRRHVRSLGVLGHEVVAYDIVKECDGLDTVLKSDAIVIASPTPTHHEYFKKAFLAEKPVFMEKPIAHVYDAALQNVMMVGYNLRFHSCVIKAKEWIDAGFLGEPIWANLVCAQYNNKPDYLRDGVILNWSHEIDLALYLLGPAYVKSCSNVGNEALADILLWHGNGCQSTIHLDYLTKPEIRQTIIVGTKCTIIIDLVHRVAFLRSELGQMLDQFEGQDDWDSNYRDEMETFIARLDGKETVGCTGQEGLEVLKVCLEAKRLSQ